MISASTSSTPESEPAGAPPLPPASSAPPPIRPRGRPPLENVCILHGTLPGEGEPRIVVRQTALQQIATHCAANLQAEVGGALLGYPYHHNQQSFVEVLAAIPAHSPDHGPVHFTFTADVWAQLQRDRAAYPQLDVVGWFHTHPDLGVFFSVDDVVVHSAAFTQPWQVALVVDPVRAEASFFGWQEDGIGAIAGFYELAEDESAAHQSVINWRVTVEPTSAAPVSLTATPQPEPWLPPVSPWVGVVLGGLSLLLSLAALIIALR